MPPKNFGAFQTTICIRSSLPFLISAKETPADDNEHDGFNDCQYPQRQGGRNEGTQRER